VRAEGKAVVLAVEQDDVARLDAGEFGEATAVSGEFPDAARLARDEAVENGVLAGPANLLLEDSVGTACRRRARGGERAVLRPSLSASAW